MTWMSSSAMSSLAGHGAGHGAGDVAGDLAQRGELGVDAIGGRTSGDVDVVAGLDGGGVVVELLDVAGLGVVEVVEPHPVGAGGQATQVVVALVVGLGVADIGPDPPPSPSSPSSRNAMTWMLSSAMSSPPGTVPVTVPAMWPVIWFSVVSWALMPSVVVAGGDVDVVGGLEGGGVVVELAGCSRSRSRRRRRTGGGRCRGSGRPGRSRPGRSVVGVFDVGPAVCRRSGTR